MFRDRPLQIEIERSFVSTYPSYYTTHSSFIEMISAFQQKQLILHAMPLPLDMIRLINEFLVSTKICPLVKQRKDTIHRLISENAPRNWVYWTYRGRIEYEFEPDESRLIDNLFIFLVPDSSCHDFLAYFCKKCGNYCNFRSALCKCNPA